MPMIPRRLNTSRRRLPFWQHPPQQFAPVIDALVELEHRTREGRRAGAADGSPLRSRKPSMPSTASSPSRSESRAVPLVGGGRSVFSFTHGRTPRRQCWPPWIGPPPESSISSTMPPTPIADWLPALAALVGAPAAAPARGDRPTRRWRMGLAFLTRLRGADNARARETLNWRPRYSSWRQGFQDEFGQRFPDASGNETVPANAA